MYTEPELLNERLERLAMVLDEIMPNCALLVRDALELLKEQQNRPGREETAEGDNAYSGHGRTGQESESMSAKDIIGLWCDDITFCQEDCEDMDCPRNKHNIRDRRFPHSYFVDLPPDCPKKEEHNDPG